MSTIKTPQKILVIALRYLGDVLLVTPLLRSLRQAYPDAQIDVLVYANTAAMLEGNPDISQLITQTVKPSLRDFISILVTLFRRYDIAVSTQVGDRPFFIALCASAFRVAPVPPKKTKGWWKRYLVQQWVEFDDHETHTVLQHLKLADLLGVPRIRALVVPKTEHLIDVQGLNRAAFCVLHVHPQWTYKRWTVEGWIEIAHYCQAEGLQIVLSGGPADTEQAYIQQIAEQLPAQTLNLAGKLTLAELAALIAQSKVFIGPDTGITHLAAATGAPVVALFGPTNPVKWAPWPIEYALDTNPFDRVGSRRVNNVLLLQGEARCVPCHLEGCERHQQSHSECLDTLAVSRVKAAVAQMIKPYAHEN